MALKTIKVSRNADNTLTVRVGRAVEHIGIESKTKGEVYDAVKYAIISKGECGTHFFPKIKQFVMQADEYAILTVQTNHLTGQE